MRKKEIYKNKYKAPFLNKDNEQDTSFMEGEPNSFHMIWSNVKNKNADLHTASEHELRFDTGNMHFIWYWFFYGPAGNDKLI